MTGDRRYFRVTDNLQSGAPQPTPKVGTASETVAGQKFLQLSHRRPKQHQELEAAAADTVPDPKEKRGTERWMAKLSIDKYNAGLQKSEMVSSYKIEDGDEDVGLSDLRITSTKLLSKTWKGCQQGPDQQMTDLQAARISSF
ncbi:hypothetical protein LTR81_025506 [Elasticomyces elasticus]